ncbi:MAG: tetratricopeptide repeat protein [Candidatus Poribacteria bacterium]|nr:tetratricopeptide repeat protein [Candidatus Poribacteria bacterium]
MKHIQRTFVWLIAVMLIGGTAFSSSAQDAATLAAAKTQLDKEYRKAKSDKDAREILDRMDEKGLVIAAVDYFASALKTAPTDGRLQFAYAESVRRVADPRYELDRLEEARIQAENALSQAPNERERRLTLARVHLAMKNGDAALDALKPFLGDGTQEIDPPFDKGAHYVAAQVYKQKRDSANADFHLSTILERDSKNVDVRLELADILRRDGWYEKSAEQLGIALRHRNRDPQIYYALGKVYAHMNEPDKVIDMYRRAKTHDPDNAQARYDLAHIFLDNDNGRYAILSIRSAMAVDGRYEKHIEALKDVSTLKAVEILITAATETPDNADLFVFLGRLQLKTGNRSAAKTSFQSAKAADRTRSLARSWRNCCSKTSRKPPSPNSKRSRRKAARRPTPTCSRGWRRFTVVRATRRRSCRPPKNC